MTAFKLLASISILFMGFACAWFYLRRPVVRERRTVSPFAGNRPWRRLGAAICLLLSVMFVVGVYVVEIPERPIPYAVYWIIMLGLVVWLFTLAVRDVMYTRKLVEHWRREFAEDIDDAEGQIAKAKERRHQ